MPLDRVEIRPRISQRGSLYVLRASCDPAWTAPNSPRVVPLLCNSTRIKSTPFCLSRFDQRYSTTSESSLTTCYVDNWHGFKGQLTHPLSLLRVVVKISRELRAFNCLERFAVQSSQWFTSLLANATILLKIRRSFEILRIRNLILNIIFHFVYVEKVFPRTLLAMHRRV